MRIVSVRTDNFRNLRSLDLSDLARVNILVGRNAQGKTNILEAIFTAAAGSSFRTSKDSFLIGKDQDSAQVFVDLITDGGQEKFIQLFWSRQNDLVTRITKVNAQPTSRMNLIKTFPAIIFSPEDIDLIRLSAAQRRRILNLIIGRHDLEYRQDLLEYGKILRQRNQLLLMIKQSRADTEELGVWNEKMAQVGVRLTHKRSALVLEITKSMADFYKIFANNHQNIRLKLQYIPSIKAANPKEYEAQLQRLVSLDIARVTTTQGIHRDDMLLMLEGDDMRYLSSRGEFRSAVLALKFAEAKYLKEKLGEDPVYLLDDVFSELDSDRRAALVEEIKHFQVFITSNDESIAKLFSSPKVWKVEQGEVQEYTPTV